MRTLARDPIKPKNFFWVLASLSVFLLIAGFPERLLAGNAESSNAGRFADPSRPAMVAQAGTAASVEGDVRITTPPRRNARRLKKGDEIFMGDKIETGGNGQLQISLLDQTFFTLGPLSTVIIDEFVYDPSSAKGKGNVVKGLLRAVSGKVQKNEEEVPQPEAEPVPKAGKAIAPSQTQEHPADMGQLLDKADALGSAPDGISGDLKDRSQNI